MLDPCGLALSHSFTVIPFLLPLRAVDAPNRGTPPGTPFVLVGSAEGILKARLMMLDAAEIDDGDMVVVDDGGTWGRGRICFVFG